MKFKKPLIVAGATSILGLAAVVGVASAQTSPTGTTLVDKIANAFHLNKADVQKVFDQNKADHQASREQSYEDRLNQAVTDRKLTAEQKDKILAKHNELLSQLQSEKQSMKDQRQDMQNKTQTERQQLRTQRQAQMQKLRDDISAWEKANNVPSGYLGVGGGGFGHGPGDPGFDGPR
ncbi:MAG TPA: hypothetical protein VLF41_02095 [Candidatus Nanoarchaeia archaeon]|nr:hypothetical protein [Candidatus Nanoarchaeia archaeon]